MCLECKAAGRLTAFYGPGIGLLDLRSVKRMHRKCKYPTTCTCQHKTPEVTIAKA